jgi:hypothetical protein
MSLETEIKNLTAAVRDLIGVMNGAKQETLNVAPAAPVAQAPALVVESAPVATPVVESVPVVATPQMPAAPTFVAPAAPAPAASGAPFSDPKGLIDYVMGAYKALGAAKGAQIQNVLVGLGYQNINDVKPEHYGALHAGVEALKG